MAAEEPTRHRLRVLVFGPGADTKGGITTFSELAGRLSSDDLEIKFVLTHADAKWLHITNFARSIATAVSVRRQPRLVFHINIASYGSTFRKYFIGTIAKSRGIPYVLNVHCGAYERFFADLNPFLKKRVRSLFCSAEYVVVIGNSDQKLFTEVVGVDSARVVLVPNGTPGPSGFQPRPAGSTVKVVYVGLVAPAKGAFDLLRALVTLNEIPGWQAVIAGDGDLAKAKAIAQAGGISDRVDFPGWVDQATVRGLLQSAGLFVLPSYSEGLPFALLEAMAEGCAVITTPVGAIVDVVESGVDGVLVEPGDVECLAREIRELVESRDLASRLGAAAHSKWKASYSDDVMLERMVNVWRKAVSQP